MKKLLIATTNWEKIEEYKQMLGNLGIEFISLADLNVTADSPEDHETFEENAMQKAKFYYDLLKIPVITEDSGIEVENLCGFPGVHSKRWMEESSYDIKVRELLKTLDGKSSECKYVAAIAYYDGETEKTFRGECHGKLVEPTDNRGFGYDVGFYYPEKKDVFANLSKEFKNSISHRRKALDQLLKWMK